MEILAVTDGKYFFSRPSRRRKTFLSSSVSPFWIMGWFDMVADGRNASNFSFSTRCLISLPFPSFFYIPTILRSSPLSGPFCSDNILLVLYEVIYFFSLSSGLRTLPRKGQVVILEKMRRSQLNVCLST